MATYDRTLNPSVDTAESQRTTFYVATDAVLTDAQARASTSHRYEWVGRVPKSAYRTTCAIAGPFDTL